MFNLEFLKNARRAGVTKTVIVGPATIELFIEDTYVGSATFLGDKISRLTIQQPPHLTCWQLGNLVHLGVVTLQENFSCHVTVGSQTLAMV